MSGAHVDPGRLAAFDRLSGSERAVVLRHAAGCSACRDRLLADDPTRIFAFLDTSPVPAAALDRLTTAVNAELDRPAPRRRASSAWGPIAASLLLGALVGAYLLNRPDLPGLPELPGNVPPATTAAVGAGARPVDTVPASGIELLEPTDAQVYDLSVGETQIVMIFDKGLDI